MRVAFIRDNKSGAYLADGYAGLLLVIADRAYYQSYLAHIHAHAVKQLKSQCRAGQPVIFAVDRIPDIVNPACNSAKLDHSVVVSKLP